MKFNLGLTLREGEEEQRATAESVYGEKGGEGKDKVDCTKAERGVERLVDVSGSLKEDGGGVEGDNVDTCCTTNIEVSLCAFPRNYTGNTHRTSAAPT